MNLLWPARCFAAVAGCRGGDTDFSVPPHRSGLAGFPHPALASGSDAQAARGIRVADMGQRLPAGDELLLRDGVKMYEIGYLFKLFLLTDGSFGHLATKYRGVDFQHCCAGQGYTKN
jgi:hypothetical protein